MRQLGRKSRLFNPKIAHMSAIAGAMILPEPPVSVDWTHNIPHFGMMLNDQLGDCTCAAVYHARQIWTANVITEQTESDDMVLKLYEEACGYVPGNLNSDNGGVEQHVLLHLLNTGFPLNDGSRDKILAFVEVDPRNIDDVKRTINECGVAYIGFEVPKNLLPSDGSNPAPVWKLDPNDCDTEGGHAVILAGYDEEGPIVISWGEKYKMTWEFFQYFTDEVYAIASNDWFLKTGKTPLGLTLDELKKLMIGIRG